MDVMMLLSTWVVADFAKFTMDDMDYHASVIKFNKKLSIVSFISADISHD